MNFIEGTFRRTGDLAGLDLGMDNFIPLPNSTAAAEGEKLTLGVRPEHFTLAEQGQGVASQVVVVEPTGAEIQVNSKIGASDVVSVFRERHAFAPGDIIRLLPDLAKVHLFHTQGGLALA